SKIFREGAEGIPVSEASEGLAGGLSDAGILALPPERFQVRKGFRKLQVPQRREQWQAVRGPCRRRGGADPALQALPGFGPQPGGAQPAKSTRQSGRARTA